MRIHIEFTFIHIHDYNYLCIVILGSANHTNLSVIR